MAMIDLRAESREALEQIDDVLHDRWFDVEDVRCDDVSRSVQVSFRDASKGAGRAAGEGALVLEIRNVDRHVVKDTERVGLYDFNRLVLSRDGRMLRIETGIPLGFEVHVTGLDVRLFES